jgi:hypothetical protein
MNASETGEEAGPVDAGDEKAELTDLSVESLKIEPEAAIAPLVEGLQETGDISKPASLLYVAAPGDIQQIGAAQIAILNQYYQAALRQARTSFTWAVIAAAVGLLFFIGAVYFMITARPQAIATVSIIGGAIVEAIAGLQFALYGRAVAQLGTFRRPLAETHRLLLANSVCEMLEGDIKHNTRAALVSAIASSVLESDT